MSPYLTPGIRKLPSQLELQILADIWSSLSNRTPATGKISSLQTAILTGITNGDFEQLLDQWNHRGTVQTTQFTTSTAVTLTEGCPLLSQLSRTFILPDDPSQRILREQKSEVRF